MPTNQLSKAVDRVARTHHAILADKDGNLPTRIEILKVGMWDTPNHGMFMITPADCQEMVANFKAGIGLPGQGLIGAPIDFSHNSHQLAAGWIKELVFENDTVYADPVDWTDAGKAALQSGEYKCFSPEFYPGCRGGWEDPEEYGVYIPNVLVGGGLTNIPLFKGLAPIVASQNGDTISHERNTIYVSASVKERTMPTLEEILAKDKTTLTEDDKNTLAQNKDQLTDDQKTNYGFEVAAADTTVVVESAPVVTEEPVKETEVPAPTTVIVEDAVGVPAAVAASLVSGESMVIKASDWKATQDQLTEMRKEKVTASVKQHIARGAVRADQLDKTVERVMADASFADFLTELPDNESLKASQGSNANGADLTAEQEAKDKANELITASKADGKEIDFGTAISRVFASNKDLETRYNNETRGEEN